MTVLGYTEFLQKANTTIQNSQKMKGKIALVLVNFDNFCELDGILGYHAVDSLQQEAGLRLVSAMLETDIVGYIGRHQLACLLIAPLSAKHVELAGHKILRVLGAPYHQSDPPIFLPIRVGISVVNLKGTLDQLLREANLAISIATRERELLYVYSENAKDLKTTKYDLLSDLNLEIAIQESRIFLEYQPQLLLKTNKIIGAEALLRWNHPNRGPILADLMVSVAERTDLITKLTYWVFNTAMRHCAELINAGLSITVSVNFSAYNLREPDLIDIVSEALQMWNIPIHLVKIELTETAVMEEHARSLETLHRLKDMGFRISMDDFGVGYSSMALLAKLPIDEVKIDISFIRDMQQKPHQKRIVAAMIDLAHGLEMNVVAEGVENIETQEQLRELGCDLIQGYLVGYPMKLPAFIDKVTAYNAKN